MQRFNCEAKLHCTMKQESFIHCYRFVNKFILKCHTFDRLCEKFNSTGTWITNNHSTADVTYVTHAEHWYPYIFIEFQNSSAALPFVRFIFENLWPNIKLDFVLVYLYEYVHLRSSERLFIIIVTYLWEEIYLKSLQYLSLHKCVWSLNGCRLWQFKAIVALNWI